MSGYRFDVSAVQFDVIIIGAGINGAAIARDAAMRGLRVLLADKGDISAGTTSWSTRLIHGGLRYLEHFEVPLVRESLHERSTLLRTAPHLVRPLHFLIPLYAGGSRGAGIIRLGMLAYEVLSADSRDVDHHRMLDAAQAEQLAPGLDPEGLRGGALYSDAQAVYPERLALENALSAREYGALILPYTRVTGFDVANGRTSGVHLRDERSGHSYLAHGAVVVNAAGANRGDQGKPHHRRRVPRSAQGRRLHRGGR